MTPELRIGIRFAETRLSDLICQNDCQALEFKGYGKVGKGEIGTWRSSDYSQNFITRHGFSPDAFVQMAFQAAYFGLYGDNFFLWLSALYHLECLIFFQEGLNARMNRR